MSQSVPLVPSGIAFLDEAWGGVYKGGSYIIVGPRKSGRTSLGLQFAEQAGEGGCIYFTTSRPRKLLIQSTALDLELERHLQEGSITVVRIAPPLPVHAERGAGCEIADRLAEIEEHVLVTRPARVVFDELTPFAGTDGAGVLPQTFSRLVETFEEEGVTSMFILGEPAAAPERAVTEELVRESTASIYLQRTVATGASDRPGGRMLIIPNVGHAEGQFVARYFVESRRPLQIEPRDAWSRMPLHEEWGDDHGRTLLPDASSNAALDQGIPAEHGGARP